MLTPMMTQYLVGLCCLRHDPEAIDITIGDLVYDFAAEKKVLYNSDFLIAISYSLSFYIIVSNKCNPFLIKIFLPSAELRLFRHVANN
jgi:hypothetical protein